MLVVPLLLLLLLLVLSAAATSDVIRSAKLHHARHMKLKASAPAPTNFLSVVADAPSLTCDPADYGGDATGEKDSTDALQSCMAKLLASASSRKMASGITDLGGVTLDLAGGTFLTSASLVIPPLFGNMHVNGGTLRASPNFPKSDHLFTIGNSSCAPDGQKSCNEFISFTDIMFDANFHAAGGAVVAHVMGTTFTNTFFTGFLGTALQIDGGHEVRDQCERSGSVRAKRAPCGKRHVCLPYTIPVQCTSLAALARSLDHSLAHRSLTRSSLTHSPPSRR